MKKVYLSIFTILVFSLTLTSCDGCSENAERAGQKMEEAGDEIEEAAEEVGDEIEEAADDVKEEINEATDDDGPDSQ